MTVSIVLHNSPLPQIEKALASIFRCEEVDLVYLLDNGQTPLPSVITEDKRIDYRKIPNNGFGAGHNVALQEVTDNHPDGFHLVMNADVEWEGDALTPLLDFMKGNKDVGMVQPRMVYADGTLQYACRLLPSPIDLFAKRFLPKSLRRRRMHRYLLAAHDHHQPLSVPYMQGSFMLIRNAALLDCGLFDERFFMYPEDIDLTRRIHERWETLYLPAPQICHLHNAESRRSLKMFGIHLANMIRYFNKWGWISDRKRRDFNRRTCAAIITPPSGQQEEGRG